MSSLGKYCVRFGSHIKQFCSNSCLEDHKKGLKVCCYCQKDISGPEGEGFMAPIGEKGQFKDFCAQTCLKKYEVMNANKDPEPAEKAPCAVCKQEKDVGAELIRSGEGEENVKLCGRPCFSAYKFGNAVDSLQCDLCLKDYDLKSHPALSKAKHVIYYEGQAKRFCGEPCQNVYVMKKRKIVPCAWCKVKKYNFDMIEQWTNESQMNTFCSINCVDMFRKNKPPSTTGGGFNGQTQAVTTAFAAMPVIQSVSSLAGAGDIPSQPDRLPIAPLPAYQLPPQQPPQIQIQTQTIREVVKDTIVHQPEPIENKNKGTLTKPFMQTKGISCRPHTTTKSCQTDFPSTPTLVPLCVPMYMPMPMQMYNAPYPVPVPIPIPVPVPIFVPTSRNTHRGVMKQIKKIQAKMPADPFEAELLALAGELAGKKEEYSDDSDYIDDVDDDGGGGGGRARGGGHPQMPQEDFEADIVGGRVVPKPLPLVTPSPSVSPAPGLVRQQQSGRQQAATNVGMVQQGGQKRRYSQTRGENTLYFATCLYTCTVMIPSQI